MVDIMQANKARRAVMRYLEKFYVVYIFTAAEAKDLIQRYLTENPDPNSSRSSLDM